MPAEKRIVITEEDKKRIADRIAKHGKRRRNNYGTEGRRFYEQSSKTN